MRLWCSTDAILPRPRSGPIEQPPIIGSMHLRNRFVLSTSRSLYCGLRCALFASVSRVLVTRACEQRLRSFGASAAQIATRIERQAANWPQPLMYPETSCLGKDDACDESLARSNNSPADQPSFLGSSQLEPGCGRVRCTP
jgi:hypothetical protein